MSILTWLFDDGLDGWTLYGSSGDVTWYPSGGVDDSGYGSVATAFFTDEWMGQATSPIDINGIIYPGAKFRFSLRTNDNEAYVAIGIDFTNALEFSPVGLHIDYNYTWQTWEYSLDDYVGWEVDFVWVSMLYREGALDFDNISIDWGVQPPQVTPARLVYGNNTSSAEDWIMT